MMTRFCTKNSQSQIKQNQKKSSLNSKSKQIYKTKSQEKIFRASRSSQRLKQKNEKKRIQEKLTKSLIQLNIEQSQHDYTQQVSYNKKCQPDSYCTINQKSKPKQSKKISILLPSAKLYSNENLVKLQENYSKIVLNTLKRHESSKKMNKSSLPLFPEITFQQFSQIWSYWCSPLTEYGKIIKPTKRITFVQNINFDIICRLRPKSWLNDEVINSYLQLLSMEMAEIVQNHHQTKSQSNYCRLALLNSYFLATQATAQKVSRQIFKKGFTSGFTFIVPIHDVNHWYFVRVSNKSIVIFDSLMNNACSIKKYQQKNQIKNIKIMHKLIYNPNAADNITKFQLILCKNYPQQNNTDDCGIMMLCGIREIVNKQATIAIKFLKQKSPLNKQQKKTQQITGLDHFKQQNDCGCGCCWQFSCKDTDYKRVLMASELLDQRIKQLL